MFWNAIQEAKHKGLRVFDLGRSDWDNAGLITFKDRWGSSRSSLVYSRISVSPPSDGFAQTVGDWAGRVSRRLIPYMPNGILRLVGSIAYRHIA